MVATLPLASFRGDEDWVWDILDNNDNFIGTLDGVNSGSIKRNVNTTIRSGGSLSWSGVAPPAWPRIRLRPRYTAELSDGSSVDWPMGVFIPAAPVINWNGTLASADVELFDKLLVLEEDAIDITFSLPAGTVVTDAIRSVIEDAGETHHSIEDSPETLTSNISWKIGTKKLTIVNELLEAINYFSLWVDEMGTYRGTPYLPPRSRGLSWEFKDDHNGIYDPEFEYDLDTFGKPNKVVLVSQGSGDAEGLVAVSTNTDPDSPISYQARGDGTMDGGRWVTRVETGVDATSQEVLQAKADRIIEEAKSLSGTLEIQHALIPLDLNNLVTFRREPASIDTSGVVRSMEIPCTVGGLVTTVITEVQ